VLRSEKKKFISDLEKIYKISNSIVIVHYHGLTVLELTALRRSLKCNGASFKVVKNTLSKIAAFNTKFRHNAEMFSGPTAIAYSEDMVTAAQIVVKFAKNNDNLKIVGGIVNNEILDVCSIQYLAKLPSLDWLRSKIIRVLNTPALNLAAATQFTAGAMVRLIRAYAEQNNDK